MKRIHPARVKKNNALNCKKIYYLLYSIYLLSLSFFDVSIYKMVKNYLISSTVNLNAEYKETLRHQSISHIMKSWYVVTIIHLAVDIVVFFRLDAGTKVEQLSTPRISDHVQREGTRVNNEFSIVLQCGWILFNRRVDTRMESGELDASKRLKDCT